MNYFSLIKLAKIELQPIILSDIEKRIFSLINKVADYARTTLNINITPRLAGGAVRDHLLGIEVDDIDIVVDNISGLEFANLISKYAKLNNIQDIGNVHEVSLEKTADEKSKEVQDETLKVGGINIFGQKVEFIGLRTEVYDELSRKPKIKATNDIKKDVIRRDLSINSMYYNLKTNEVEDYVNGKEDLQNMYLRTPADPLTTFKDDPLRMLRVLRFYSKFEGSTIDPKIIDIMKQSQDPTSEFSRSYTQKVHPNRASKELRKLVNGNNPIEASRLLLETGFYKLVFRIPKEWNDLSMDQQNPHHNMTLLNHTLGVMKNISSMSNQMQIPKDEKGLLLISAMLHDFGKMSPEIRKPKLDKNGLPVTFDREGKQVEHYNYINHEEESAKFARKILTDMGFDPEEKKFVERVTSSHMLPHLIDLKNPPRKLGEFLNKVDKYYRHVLLHAKADTLSKENLSQEEIDKLTKEQDDKIKLIEDYKKELGQNVNIPLLNGNEIEELVKKVSPELSLSKAFIEVKDEVKPVFYTKYLLNRLMEGQWSKRVKNKDEAISYMEKEIKNVYGLWKQQGKSSKKENNKDMNKNIEHFAKEGYNTLDRYVEKVPDSEERVSYFSFVPFKVGNKVRMRANGGVNMTMHPLIEGRVVKITDSQLFVKWESGKHKGKDMNGVISKFDINNPLALALNLERIN